MNNVDYNGLVTMLPWIAIYLLPAIVAEVRKHRNKTPIAIVNIAFGWTLVGWVACLALACTWQERTA
jgi:hypothetical protein